MPTAPLLSIGVTESVKRVAGKTPDAVTMWPVRKDKTKRGTPMRIALAMLISSLALTAQASGIYKWVDENGVVHFGEQPPSSTEVEVIKKPKSERYKQWEAEQQATRAAKEAKTTKPAIETQPQGQPTPQQPSEVDEQVARAQAAARAQRCQNSQDNLKALTSHARVREVDENGNHRVLGEDERQQRINQEQKSIRENC
ncbi:DUF4124 domain-containing protein [Microbulbifer sp. MLAF003]|uniref:DUF4124 domain-containing protein n=2 Tax=unclassified Microbulbifer TaxID=2619833 RepID=UPI0024AE6117|nr:DUF4124 domain-containing protein [Microbulbifer sp. MLAF003]WHI50707.1 DUF4124 domain-containing protein [Microbulbifer sp. MLAF003]